MSKTRGGGPLLTIEDIKKALSTDLRREGTRWETIRDAFVSLTEKLRKSADPGSLLTPTIQRELSPFWINAITNERSASVHQAKATLVFAADLMGYHLKDLADRMFFTLLKQTGSGNNTNAAHALDVVLALVRFVPSTALFTEVARARVELGANPSVLLACHRVINIMFATWPHETLQRIQTNPTTEHELGPIIVSGLTAGNDLVRRLARVNFRLIRSRYSDVARLMEERHRAKLPDKWDHMINDAGAIAEDESKLKAALDPKGTGGGVDAKNTPFFTEHMRAFALLDGIETSHHTAELVEPLSSGRESNSLAFDASVPNVKLAAPPSRITKSALTPEKASTDHHALKMLAHSPAKAVAAHVAKLPASPRGKTSPISHPTKASRGIVPPAARKSDRASESSEDMHFITPGSSVAQVVDDLHVRVRQHVAHVAKAYEGMIQGSSFKNISKLLHNHKKRRAERNLKAIGVAEQELSADNPRPAVDALLDMDVHNDSASVEPDLSAHDLADFSSALLPRLLEMRQRCNEMIAHLEEASAFAAHQQERLPPSPAPAESRMKTSHSMPVLHTVAMSESNGFGAGMSEDDV